MKVFSRIKVVPRAYEPSSFGIGALFCVRSSVAALAETVYVEPYKALLRSEGKDKGLSAERCCVIYFKE